VLLIDGVDEASSHSKAIESFVRACVEAGVRCIATSRPEGIEDRSAYQSREDWDELHLPELTIDQQRQLVKNVVEVKSKGEATEGARVGLASREGNIQRKREDGLLDILWDNGEEEQSVAPSTVVAIGARVFFQNLFNFTESRKRYDVDYKKLEDGDRALLENKTLPIQTKTNPPMFLPAIRDTMVGMTIALTNVSDLENRKATVTGFDEAGYKVQLLSEDRSDSGSSCQLDTAGELLTIQFDNIVLPRETSFQVGRDGIRIDFGLTRADLIIMFETVSKAIMEISVSCKGDEAKEKESVSTYQQETVSCPDAFKTQFLGKGDRVLELFDIACAANEKFATILKEICSRTLPRQWQDSLVLCGLKGIKRVLEKAIQDYSEKADKEGGLRKVCDIVRASIMCDTPKEMVQVLDALEKSPHVKIARFKNFFRGMDATHFRRMAVNLVVRVPVGGKHIPHVVELQIHLRNIFQFKQDNKEFMHRPYEYFREAGKKEVVMPRLKLQMDVMTEIAETPVLLALFCSAADFDGAERPTLPSSRHELYQWALAARLKDKGFMKLCQAISFENFANDKSWNQRQFTIEDVEKAREKWQVGCEFPDYSRGTSMPLIKVLDASAGLFQFSHLSVQEAFAGLHGKDHFMEAKHVLNPRALNFVRTCERGSLKVKFDASVSSIQKRAFGLDTKGEWLSTWLPYFMLLCTISPNCAEVAASLQKLDLSGCNLTGVFLGECKLQLHH
jgi:hypothetical protein